MLRFRKIIGAHSPLRLNISRKGPSSLSLGVPGLGLNVGKHRSLMTIGLPGSGLAYRIGSAGRTKKVTTRKPKTIKSFKSFKEFVESVNEDI